MAAQMLLQLRAPKVTLSTGDWLSHTLSCLFSDDVVAYSSDDSPTCRYIAFTSRFFLFLTAMRLHQSTGGKDKALQHTPSSALKYVIFLADVNRLYDVALGMYDFDLVLTVRLRGSFGLKLSVLTYRLFLDVIVWVCEFRIQNSDAELSHVILSCVCAGGSALAKGPQGIPAVHSTAAEDGI